MKNTLLLLLLLANVVSSAQDSTSRKMVDTTTHKLKEVTIKQKMPAVVLKGDTTEYNASSYKVNPDADAADLVRKMPSIIINGNKVSAAGETVLKVVVDGRSFFGDDAYATLKNLPADIIAKVQVYNEKSDQEQFTGFSEGNTSKTINIVTKPDKHDGIFGKVYGGLGTGDGSKTRYATGFDLNSFKGKQRITLTAQTNNTNINNFTDPNGSPGVASEGTSDIQTTGINYSNKWGEKADFSGSYFLNNTNRGYDRSLNKTYLLAQDSGQVYHETGYNTAQNSNHRANLRINYIFDTLNSILLTPNISIQKNNSHSIKKGNTTAGQADVNKTDNTTGSRQAGINFSGNLLYRHKFLKKRRTLSVNLSGSDNNNDNTSGIIAENIYYASPLLSDTVNQRTYGKQDNWSIIGNITYTEPAGKNGLLKVDGSLTMQPSVSDKKAYNYAEAPGNYTSPDSSLSSSFSSKNVSGKIGSSYLLTLKKYEFSVGLNYQYNYLLSDNRLPITFYLRQHFENILPVAMLRYRPSKTSSLLLNYTTNTRTPSASQLQNVVNNTDPLHLSTGNPALVQPYSHNINVNYNTINKISSSSFNATLAANYTLHNVTNSVIIARQDTVLQGQIVLPKGSQLTMPLNTSASSNFNGNVYYGAPLDFMKCRLSVGVNASLSTTPALINGATNNQLSKDAGGNITLSSNINEKIDFSISFNSSITSNNNSLNPEANTTYYNQGGSGVLNLLLPKHLVYNTSFNYQGNAGLSAGYNQSYVTWNMSFGKKIFKKQQGDIRIAAIDLLNKNNNVQRSVTETYIQDTRSSILKRYFLFTFNYKISAFR